MQGEEFKFTGTFSRETFDSFSRIKAIALEDLIPGFWDTSPTGRCYVIERAYPLTVPHGQASLESALQAKLDLWPSGFLQGPPFSLEEALFIDTETTGLARSAGTFVFLVGTGALDGERLIVRQYFMPDYGEEPRLLELVQEVANDKKGVITFNGLAFDLPLLEVRYAMNGMPFPWEKRSHLDLLPIARRLWRRTIGSCALAALEREILAFYRPLEDVPGYLIPYLYQEYLRYGETSGVARIILHNFIDILTMVALIGRMAAILQGLRAQAQDLSYWDPLALGQLYETEGQFEEAIRTYARGCRSRDSQMRAECFHRLGLLYKRQGLFSQAAEMWRRAVSEGDSLHPYVELAKYLEHVAKDWEAAQTLVSQTMERLQAGQLRCQRPDSAMADLRHRLKRLESRLTRRAPGKGELS